MSSAIRDIQSQVAQQFVETYNSWNLEAIMRTRTDTCVQYLLPASVPASRSPRTNDDYIKFFKQMQNVLHGFKMTVHKTINDPESCTVVLHATATATSPVGPYAAEWVFFLTIEGDKIARIEEFVDSKGSEAFYTKLSGYVHEQRLKEADGRTE